MADSPPVELIYYLFILSVTAIFFFIVDIAYQNSQKKWLISIILFPASIVIFAMLKWSKCKIPLILFCVFTAIMGVVASFAEFPFMDHFQALLIRICLWPIYILLQFVN